MARCIRCNDTRRVRTFVYSTETMACPQCCGQSSAQAKMMARNQFDECLRKWKLGQTGDENLRMALDGMYHVGYRTSDVSARGLAGNMQTVIMGRQERAL